MSNSTSFNVFSAAARDGTLVGPADRDRFVVVESSGTVDDGLLPRRLFARSEANRAGIVVCDVPGVV